MLQVAFWRSPRVQAVLHGLGAAVPASGWPAARVFDLIAAAVVPTPSGIADAFACAPAALISPAYAAYPAGVTAPGGSPGFYVSPGTPNAARAAMVAGAYRATFVAVVREAQVGGASDGVSGRVSLSHRCPCLPPCAVQAALLERSRDLVVVETDADGGYISLVGLDQAGPTKVVATSRQFFVNESALGGHRGHLQVVLVEDGPVRYATARANAALVGPERFRACAVGSAFLATERGTVTQFPHSRCGLPELFAQVWTLYCVDCATCACTRHSPLPCHCSA